MQVRAGVAVVDQVRPGGPVYLASLPTGPIVILEGEAVSIWHAVLRSSSLDEVTAAVADGLGVEPDLLRTDVEAFVADLVARGYLEPVE